MFANSKLYYSLSAGMARKYGVLLGENVLEKRTFRCAITLGSRGTLFGLTNSKLDNSLSVGKAGKLVMPTENQ